jgi:glutathione S-transferase
MKLYHNPFSSSSRRAVITATVLKTPVGIEFVDLMAGAQRKPEFLAINPMGRVPALIDGDFVLAESCAIMLYLADKSAESELYPKEAKQRALVHQWMFWTASHWSPVVGALNFENMLKPLFGAGPADQAQVERQNATLRGMAMMLDKRLSERPYLLGSSMTLPDIAAGCMLMSTDAAKLPVTDFEHLQRWYRSIQALEAWKASEPPPMG